MKIEIGKNYNVEKYVHKTNDIEVSNYGLLPGTDVKSILKGYKYDDDLGMWFSKHANIGYYVCEE